MAPTGPFLGTEELARGTVTRRALVSTHDRIYRNVYMAQGAELTPARRAVAAWLWSGRQATAAGLSAAALYGTQWIDPRLPAELYRRNGKRVDGIVIHRDELLDDEVQTVGGVPATTPARTAFDLGRRSGLETAVIRLDALANTTRLQRCELEALIDRHRGVRGLVQLREAVDLMDSGAESPQETRTRLVLIDAGLPRPMTQIIVRGNFGGRKYAKVDMGYEEFKVGVEYDGEHHWTNSGQYAYDIDRHAELLARGWRIIRVSADMLRYRRQVIVQRVCAALRAAGAQWPVIARILGDCVA
jgi:hypothetical protein